MPGRGAGARDAIFAPEAPRSPRCCRIRPGQPTPDEPARTLRRCVVLIGRQLSHYRITAAIGAGGMGEVYRATDTILGREVAIKVLPPEVARDPQRLGRFRREAHILASLNHPNIAAIYGLEEAEGSLFLALELIQGEDLSQLIGRGAVPVREALEIALQIAEALETAHARGIIHRDLKPANVKLTPDGHVKVLDFGLARARVVERPDGTTWPSEASQSPTLPGTGTMAGVVLGTASYMPPEQARGKAVDARADVWSFGVLLWEMLTGQKLFPGETTADVIAAVVTKRPDLDALPATTPPAVRRLIGRCLRRDLRTRQPEIASVRLELQDALAGTGDEEEHRIAGGALWREHRSRRRERWAWGLAVAGCALAALLALLRGTSPPERQPARHLSVDVPDGLALVDNLPLAISPDGSQIAIAGATPGGERQLFLRPLGSPEVQPIPGTAGAYGPFWSPDGGSIAFFTPQAVRQVALGSGVVREICPLPLLDVTNGGTWGEEGTVLFSLGATRARIYSVPAAGGEPSVVTTLDAQRQETWHLLPQFLPGGREFLFSVGSSRATFAGLYVASLARPGERRRLVSGPFRCLFAPPRSLLLAREGVLLAQSFDTKGLEVSGEPMALATSVASGEINPAWGWFAASSNGILAYAAQDTPREIELVWLDRAGKKLGTAGPPGVYGQIALSPDEKRVAVELTQEGVEGPDIWTIDLARGVTRRLTLDPAYDSNPTWMPDGSGLALASNRDGAHRVHRWIMGSDGPESPLSPETVDAYPESWSPDGKAVVYKSVSPEGQALWVVSPGREPELLLRNGFEVDEGQVSPNGRWLAYLSRESGRWEVYLGPFRRPGERIRVSPGGGGQPKWRGDGRELFYVAPDGRLMAVDVHEREDDVDVGLPRVLFSTGASDPIRDEYAVTADGQRFLVKVPVRPGGGVRIHVVLHWPSLLGR